MRHIILVSHGTMAPALEGAMAMIIGKQKNVSSTSMEDGMGANVYVDHFRELIEDFSSQDQILLLGDLAQGSPMTNAVKVLSERGLMGNTIAFAGMNLPMVITAAMLNENEDTESIKREILGESKRQIKVLDFSDDEDEKDEDI